MAIFKFWEEKTRGDGRPNWKFDCTDMELEEWHVFAAMVAYRFTFRYPVSLSQEGDRFANALEHYATNDPNNPVLLVDAVATTGNTFIRAKEKSWSSEAVPVLGTCVFARGFVPPWVHPILLWNPVWKQTRPAR